MLILCVHEIDWGEERTFGLEATVTLENYEKAETCTIPDQLWLNPIRQGHRRQISNI
jgi:hypothetical protein